MPFGSARRWSQSPLQTARPYLGLDVHAETITAAIAEKRGQISSLGKFPNRSEARVEGAIRDILSCVQGSDFDERAFFQGIAQSGARALLIGRRAQDIRLLQTLLTTGGKP